MITELLVHRFVSNAEKVDDPKVRSTYGTLSSITGIVCNVLLFIVKYIMGTIAGSISIISDAFNNLSDSANCIITLLGYKLAAKPADKDHPFGHGRIEYLTTLVIAVLIALVGFDLFRDSFDKLLHPTDITFRVIILISLVVSILVKLWMAAFNQTLGTRIQSSTLLATAKDSRNDVIATTATILALVASLFTKAPIDGIMGLFVSALIVKAAYDIIRDTLDELLGKPADAELTAAIAAKVCENPRILGIHDLIIHNYGPGNLIGSCHAEVSCEENLISIHDLIDRIEHEISEELHILMTIHMDPVETNNEQLNYCKSLVQKHLKALDEALNLHDFRMVSGETHTNLIFDVVVPFDCPLTPAEIRKGLEQALSSEPVLYCLVITFDKDLT